MTLYSENVHQEREMVRDDHRPAHLGLVSVNTHMRKLNPLELVYLAKFCPDLKSVKLWYKPDDREVERLALELGDGARTVQEACKIILVQYAKKNWFQFRFPYYIPFQAQ